MKQPEARNIERAKARRKIYERVREIPSRAHSESVYILIQQRNIYSEPDRCNLFRRTRLDALAAATMIFGRAVRRQMETWFYDWINVGGPLSRNLQSDTLQSDTLAKA